MRGSSRAAKVSGVAGVAGVGLALVASLASLAACGLDVAGSGGGGNVPGAGAATPGAAPPGQGSGPGSSGGPSSPGAGNPGSPGSPGNPADGGNPGNAGDGGAASPPPAIIYAHTRGTLYAITELSQPELVLTAIGQTTACRDLVDIAVDGAGNIVGVDTDGNLYDIAAATAACTPRAGSRFDGVWALSFLSDQGKPHLGALQKAAYDWLLDSVDPAAPVVSGESGEGDLACIGARCFATAKSQQQGADLIRFDAHDGGHRDSIGLPGPMRPTGLAQWAGALYVFDDGGAVVRVTGPSTTTPTYQIVSGGPQQGGPPDEGGVWRGAGSTLAAPTH